MVGAQNRRTRAAHVGCLTGGFRRLGVNPEVTGKEILVELGRPHSLSIVAAQLLLDVHTVYPANTEGTYWDCTHYLRKKPDCVIVPDLKHSDYSLKVVGRES